jgi:GTP-binding protein
LATSEEKAHLYSNWCFLLAVTEQRCSEVETLVFDLFANLGASDEQLEFPVLYASAKEGWVSRAYTKCTEGEERTVAPLMDAIV